MGVRVRGRQFEIDALRRWLDTLEGGRGSITIVTGADGAGKTTLLSATRDMAADKGVRVLQGQCDPHGAAMPFAPLLGALAAGEHPVADPARLDVFGRSQAGSFWLVRELGDAIEQAAAQTPVLIIIDDLQWADAATATALDTLTARLAPHPVLWLFAVSPDELPASANSVRKLRRFGAAEIELGRLDEVAVAQIARDLLGAFPEPALAKELRKAGGQPLLLVEFLRGLREEKLVTVEDGIARVTAERLPCRLLESVAAQLDRLPGEARYALEFAPLLGQRFSLDELAALVGQDPVSLYAALRSALASGLLMADGDQLGFRQEFAREAVEASMPEPVRRSARRQAVAIMLSRGAHASDVAPLVMETAEPGDRVAIEMLRQAAAEIGRTFPLAAARLSRRALELTPEEDPSRAMRARETLSLLVLAGQAREAALLIAAEHRCMGDAVVMAQARLSVSMLMTDHGPAEVAEQCRQGLQIPGNTAAVQVELLSLLVLAHEITGEIAAAEAALAAALATAETSNDSASEIIALTPQALFTFARGDWQEAVDLAGQAVARHLRPEGWGARLWLPDAWQAMILLNAMRLREAQALIDVGGRASEEVAANNRMWALLRSRALHRAGKLTDSRVAADAVLAMSDEDRNGNSGYFGQVASYVHADIALHTGNGPDLRIARWRAQQLLSASTSDAPRRLGAWLTVRLAGADSLAALRAAATPETLELLKPGYVHATSPITHFDAVELVRLLLRAGRRRDATAVAERLEGAFSAGPGRDLATAAATHARALIEDSPELALQAVDRHSPDPRPMIRAAALEDAGRLLLATAREETREAGISHLEAALGLYANARADHDAVRVRRLLRARGVHRAAVRRKASSEWPELTSSEVAVVRLVIQGTTDREVAGQLSISVHTVNSHLRNVFAKLGIRSRVELARLSGERAAAASAARH
jgi:DNA-binding CsgD family transcriptional regulator